MKKFFLLSLLILLSGCGPFTNIFYPSAEINIPNTPREYKAGYDAVWRAAIDSLDELGFVIEQMKKEDGYISTDKQVSKDAAFGRNPSAFARVREERVKVSLRISWDDGSVRLTVTPYIEQRIQDSMTPKLRYWIKAESNGALEEAIKRKIASKL